MPARMEEPYRRKGVTYPEKEGCRYPEKEGCRYPFSVLRTSGFGLVAVAVGIPVTRHPPHRSVRALISAYGS